jgi:hypothetical protein
MENEIRVEEAKEALGLVKSSQADVAERLITPWWYHTVLGVLEAGLIVAPAARSPIVLVGALFLFGIGLGTLVTVYRRMTAVWVTGYNAGRASSWAFALGAIAGLAYVISIAAAIGLGWWQVSVAMAVIVVPVTIVLGRRFDDALRGQLREGS